MNNALRPLYTLLVYKTYRTEHLRCKTASLPDRELQLEGVFHAHGQVGGHADNAPPEAVLVN